MSIRSDGIKKRILLHKFVPLRKVIRLLLDVRIHKTSDQSHWVPIQIIWKRKSLYSCYREHKQMSGEEEGRKENLIRTAS